MLVNVLFRCSSQIFSVLFEGTKHDQWVILRKSFVFATGTYAGEQSLNVRRSGGCSWTMHAWRLGEITTRLSTRSSFANHLCLLKTEWVGKCRLVP